MIVFISWCSGEPDYWGGSDTTINEGCAQLRRTCLGDSGCFDKLPFLCRLALGTTNSTTKKQTTTTTIANQTPIQTATTTTKAATTTSTTQAPTTTTTTTTTKAPTTTTTSSQSQKTASKLVDLTNTKLSDKCLEAFRTELFDNINFLRAEHGTPLLQRIISLDDKAQELSLSVAVDDTSGLSKLGSASESNYKETRKMTPNTTHEVWCRSIKNF